MIRTLVVVLSGLLFTSCMHLGMHSMEGDHQSTRADPVVQKEVVVGNVKAVATFPPMVAGGKQVLSLQLSSATSQKPVSGADVRLHAQLIQQERPDNYQAMTDRTGSEAEITDVWNVRELNDEPGIYSLSYGSPDAGQQDLTFHVYAINGKRLDPELIIGKRVVIRPEAMDHSRGMMGSSHIWNTLFIVGGVVMVGMMVFMFMH